MTTPAVTEAEALDRANATYTRVMRSEWAGDGNAIRAALAGLLDARETYYAVLNDDMHPASAYPELEYDDDAFGRALSMAVRDAADWAGELDRLVPPGALEVAA